MDIMMYHLIALFCFKQSTTFKFTSAFAWHAFRVAGRAKAAAAAATIAAPHDKPVLPSPDAVIALIRARRSIFPKDYTGAKVPREQIERLLDAANWAPTHHLTQPWK
jgi:hypothetical protein